jgi:hypothetical protein
VVIPYVRLYILVDRNLHREKYCYANRDICSCARVRRIVSRRPRAAPLKLHRYCRSSSGWVRGSELLGLGSGSPGSKKRTYKKDRQGVSGTVVGRSRRRQGGAAKEGET